MQLFLGAENMAAGLKVVVADLLKVLVLVGEVLVLVVAADLIIAIVQETNVLSIIATPVFKMTELWQ